jgi:hypothetical protein
VIGPCGYGRYDDDTSWIGCPRAKTDMTPCIARDGHTAMTANLICAGCRGRPGELIRELADAGIEPAVEFIKPRSIRPSAATVADKLAEIVRDCTEPGDTSSSRRHVFPCGCMLGFSGTAFEMSACSEEHLALLTACEPVMGAVGAR